MVDLIEQLQRSAVNALNKGDFRTLHALCLKILSLNSQHADAWFFLSLIAAAQQQLKKAVELVDKALEISPQQPEYLSQKAKYHCFLKQDDDAFIAAENARSLNPENALTLDTLGVVYTNLGRYELSREMLLKAVNLKPDNPQFQFNLATAEQFLGNNAEAKQHYETAIELHPSFARAYWSLSELEKNKMDGNRIAELEALLNSQQLNAVDELYLSHALSREYENKGEFAKAFEILTQGKKRRAQQIQYSFEEDKQIFESLHAVFSEQADTSISGKSDVPENSAAKQKLGEGVIFIVGMPRSGTTLIERILSSHTEVESLGELQNFGLAVRKFIDSKSSKVLDDDIIRAAMNIDPQRIGQEYLDSVKARRSGARYFIDKMPLNFLYIGFIRKCLPGAKIVCIRRNPLDTCLSNYRQLFAINFSYYNYHYNIEDTAHYYACFHKLMQLWKESESDVLHMVDYEELTQQPELHIQQLLRYIGIDWQQACLDFHKNKSAVTTPSAVQVREKMYTRAVGRWRNYETELKDIITYFAEQNIL